MFGANTGSSSLFNNINTSTPTSTPTPANNVFTVNQKPSGSAFGNINKNQENISTPSPATGINDTKTNTNGGLFSQNNTQLNAAGLFGQNSNAMMANSSKPLFGHSPSTTLGSTSSGLFSTTDNLQNTNQGLNNPSGRLVNSSLPAKDNFTLQSGSLFGGKAASLNSTTNSGSSLFGNKSQSNLQSSGIFGNKPLVASFGADNSQNQNNAGQHAQGQPASISTNPYGLQLSSIPLTTMPESITASLSNKKKNDSTLNLKKRTFSTSSNVGTTPLVSNQSTLISKLSLRLNSIKSSEPTQGLFSPRKALNDSSFEVSDRLKDPKSFGTTLGQGKEYLTFLKRAEVSDLRKLKIDPSRSAAKKQRLLTGKYATTKVKLLGEKKEIKGQRLERLNAKPNNNRALENNKGTANSSKYLPGATNDQGYWCSPTIEQLQQLSDKQLAAVPNFVIGRKGYGSISFDLDVGLREFKGAFQENLFGKIVIFNDNRTVEVYPDDSTKPAIGLGLNVPATITLELIYPVEKKTNLPITDNSDLPKVQLFVKRLKSMREMEFISYNPYGGIWTFKVKHFSIWGLINDSDVEIDDADVEEQRENEVDTRIVAVPRRSGFSKGGDTSVPGAFDKLVHIPSNMDTDLSMETHGDLSVAHLSIGENVGENYDIFPELLEEKPYEPSDVEEDDFAGLEVEPNLEISSNWHKQLKLAGDVYKSVFASSRALQKTETMKDIIFTSFNKDLKVYKAIKKERRLGSGINFANFCSDSTLLINGGINCSGWIRKRLPSTLADHKSSINVVFRKSLETAIVTSRANSYPVIDGWELTFNDIADAYCNVPNEYRIWRLLSVLFDKIYLGEDDINEDVKEVLYKKRRHVLLCQWIMDAVRDEIEAKVKTATGTEKVFLHLANMDIVGATTSAIETNNSHLAALVALLGSNDPFVRDLSASQLKKWKSLGYKVDLNIVRIYQLLTGSPLISANTSIPKDFSWLAKFGLQIFYGDIDSLSLEELVLSSLDHSIKTSNELADDQLQSIFRLFCSGLSPERLIGKLIVPDRPLDLRLAWFFMQLLKRSDIKAELYDRVTLQFTEQLRIEGMHQEALFVLCFLQDDRVAKHQIDLLVSTEIIFSSNSSKEILRKLKIPDNLYYESLAMHDKNRGDHLSEARNLLKAKQYSAAEKVIITNVAPSLLISGTQEELSVLRGLLEKFPAHQMDSWSRGLGVFEKYLNIVLDKKDEKKMLDELVHELPLLSTEYSSYKQVSVLCCVISKSVCHILLEKYRDILSNSTMKDRLLALPLGQPEIFYLKHSLASI